MNVKRSKEEMRHTLGNNLDALLQLKKKTRTDVSNDLNINYSIVCDWVKGRTYPSENNLGRLAFYFDTTVEQLTNPNTAISENGFDPEQSSSKRKISVIDISTEEWIKSPIDYEWVSTKHLKTNGNYLMFEVVDDILSPTFNIGDMVLAESLDGKIVKTEGNYMLKLNDYDLMLFVHIYLKENGFLVAPLNNNNSKGFLPRFYTNEEFISNVRNVHKAIRVSKNI